MNLTKTIASTCACLLLATNSVKAEENLWLYTKGTDTRPQGSYELKLSDITRVGKDSGYYYFHDIRPEIEYGITDRLTIGAEIMIFSHDFSLDSEIDPMYSTQQENADGRVKQTKYGGYELALKYNVLSPYKDSVGLSFGFNFEDRDTYRLDGAQIDQKSYVTTVFLQKNYLDDTLVFAFNWKTEFERRKSGGDSVLEEEIAFDISAGVSYRVKPKHFVGLEVRSQSDYLNPYEDGQPSDTSLSKSEFDLFDWKLGSQHQIGTYFGPTYHYAEQNWWFTAGILFQVAGGGSEHAYNEHGKNFDEHEEFHIGASYGYEF
jgi:hypothetical protein